MFRDVPSEMHVEPAAECNGRSTAYAPAPRYGEGCFILGTRCHAVSVDDVHSYMERVISDKRQALVLNINVHCANLCQKLPWLREFMNQAQMVFCDGDGVRWGARLLGQEVPPKITYDRWIWQLAELAETKSYRLYFLGGKPGVADAAAENLRLRFPKLSVVGTHHGYFRKEGDENRHVIAAINDSRPDILVLGFGMPVQERWLCDHWQNVSAHIFLTGGAVFDYASGRARRAPEWMIRCHLEWLHRLQQEPLRLFKRYILGNPHFMLRVLWDRWSRAARRSSAGADRPAGASSGKLGHQLPMGSSPWDHQEAQFAEAPAVAVEVSRNGST